MRSLERLLKFLKASKFSSSLISQKYHNQNENSQSLVNKLSINPFRLSTSKALLLQKSHSLEIQTWEFSDFEAGMNFHTFQIGKTIKILASTDFDCAHTASPPGPSLTSFLHCCCSSSTSKSHSPRPRRRTSPP